MENFYCDRKKDTIYYAVDYFNFLWSNLDGIAPVIKKKTEEDNTINFIIIQKSLFTFQG